jgi:hypothetical protein
MYSFRRQENEENYCYCCDDCANCDVCRDKCCSNNHVNTYQHGPCGSCKRTCGSTGSTGTTGPTVPIALNWFYAEHLNGNPTDVGGQAVTNGSYVTFNTFLPSPCNFITYNISNFFAINSGVYLVTLKIINETSDNSIMNVTLDTNPPSLLLGNFYAGPADTNNSNIQIINETFILNIQNDGTQFYVINTGANLIASNITGKDAYISFVKLV